MILAIVKKELRETWGIAALALGVYLIYVDKLTVRGVARHFSFFGALPEVRNRLNDIPFIGENFLGMYVLIGFGLAIALGLRQSAWEPSQGTSLYLLHLPLGRRTLFLAKFATGISLLLACMLVPTLLYGLWAAAPGTHATPFEWSMTGQAFRVWSVMPLTYLGAFASGIRPARWFGTRLLPLPAVLLPAVIAFAVPAWWWVGAPVIAITTLVLISNILLVAETRDY